MSAEGTSFDPQAIIARMRQEYWRNLATTIEDDAPDVVAAVAFTVGPGRYALPIERIREVLKMPWIAALPRTPEFLLGVVNVHGRVIPTLDLRPLLGHPPRPADRDTRLVTVRMRQGADAEVGFRVDRVLGPTEIAQAALEPPPAVRGGVPREFVLGQGQVDGALLALLDVDAILGDCRERLGGPDG